MLDADAVINNSSQKVGGSNAHPDPAPKKWVGQDPEKHIGSTPLVRANRFHQPPTGATNTQIFDHCLVIGLYSKRYRHIHLR